MGFNSGFKVLIMKYILLSVLGCVESLPDMQWGYIGSLGMPEWEEMKSPMISQGVVLFSVLLDLNLSWGSLGRIQEER